MHEKIAFIVDTHKCTQTLSLHAEMHALDENYGSVNCTRIQVHGTKIESLNCDTRSSPSQASSQFFCFFLRGLCGDDRLSIHPYLNIYFWGEDRSSRPAELPGLSLADWQQGAFHLALDHALSHALSKLAMQQFPIKAKWQYIDLLRPATSS